MNTIKPLRAVARVGPAVRAGAVAGRALQPRIEIAVAASRPVPSAASKRPRVALLWGTPHRAVGCFSGFTGLSSVTGFTDVGVARVGALPLVAPAPDPELLEHPAMSSAMTATPNVIQRPRL